MKEILKNINEILTSKQFWKAFAKQILFILILSVLFLVDDYIFKIFNGLNKATLSIKMVSLAVGLATAISIIKNKKIIYCFLGILCIMELVYLVYLAYFGTFLHPTAIPLIIKEAPEIAETGFGMFGKVYYAFVAVLLQYGLIFLFIKKFKDKIFSFKFSWIILVLFVSLIPVRAIRETSMARLVANPAYPSIYNSMRIFSGYFFNILPNSLKDNNEIEKFNDYTIKENKPLHKKATVVLVYGEGFSYARQGLYGYDKDTTPNLSEFAKTYKNFIYTKGIAGAVATQQSIPAFFNLQREPKNYKMQIDMNINLFKLAKNHDFKTLFISVQTLGLTNSIGRQFIDDFMTVEDIQSLYDKERDEALLTTLQTKNLTENNFIVLQQRNLHSPYDKNYDHKKEQFNKFKDVYDNATLYNDYVLAELINYIKTTIKTPYYIFITSDHNELTGEDGLYGHTILTPKGADVPMMLYASEDANPEIINEFKNTFRLTHNELGILIAKIFGYEIINTNTPKDVYYINGNDTLARFGYIKVIKDFKNQSINYEMIDGNKMTAADKDKLKQI